MDADRFDLLTRAMRTSRGRRAVLGLVLGGAVGVRTSRTVRAQSICRDLGESCRSQTDCCLQVRAMQPSLQPRCRARITPAGELTPCFGGRACCLGVGGPCSNACDCCGGLSCLEDHTCGCRADQRLCDEQCIDAGACCPESERSCGGLCISAEACCPGGLPCLGGCRRCFEGASCVGGVCVCSPGNVQCGANASACCPPELCFADIGHDQPQGPPYCHW